MEVEPTPQPPSGGLPINSQFLIHVGVEVVVIGGVFFYLNKQNSLLREEVQLLRKRVDECEQMVARQNQILAQHGHVLREIMGGHPPPRSRPPPQPEPEEPKISDEELDDILKQELETIREGRRSPPSSAPPSECEGDSCSIEELLKKSPGKQKNLQSS